LSVIPDEAVWPLLLVIPEGNLHVLESPHPHVISTGAKRSGETPVFCLRCQSFIYGAGLIVKQLVSTRQHALMKNSADEDATISGPIKDDVLPLLDAPKPRMDRTAWTTQLRHLRNTNETFNETVEINLGLPAAPHVGRVIDDICEIKFRQHRKPIPAQAVRLPFVLTLL
jgi:hypothetical protein